MNSNFDKDNVNRYDGNGWSKYQIMVLQQLEDHSELLHNLNKELIEIKQTIAVSEAELKMWRKSIMSDVETLEEQMDCVLYEDEGVSSRITEIENELKYKEKAAAKNKALWAAIGAGAACVADLIIKLMQFVKTV